MLFYFFWGWGRNLYSLFCDEEERIIFLRPLGLGALRDQIHSVSVCYASLFPLKKATFSMFSPIFTVSFNIELKEFESII